MFLWQLLPSQSIDVAIITFTFLITTTTTTTIIIIITSITHTIQFTTVAATIDVTLINDHYVDLIMQFTDHLHCAIMQPDAHCVMHVVHANLRLSAKLSATGMRSKNATAVVK